MKVLKTEPVLFIAVIQTAIILGVSFGVKISPAQTAAIIAFANAVLAIYVRSQVTPTSSIQKQPEVSDAPDGKTEPAPAPTEDTPTPTKPIKPGE